MKQEKTHLELQWVEVKENKLILHGVRANSRKEYGEKPELDIIIKLDQSDPKYIVDSLALIMKKRYNDILNDCKKFEKASNIFQ